MSTSDKLTYLATTKDNLKTAINYTGANITTEKFRAYPEKLYNKYIDIINNGTDSLYNNLPKVTGTGTNISLANTANCKMQLSDYKGQTTQSSTPTPSSPQPINVVSGEQDINVYGKNLLKFDNSQNTDRNIWTYTSETGQLIECSKSTGGGSFYAVFETIVEENQQYIISVDDDTNRNFYCYKDKIWGTSVTGLTNKNINKNKTFTFTASYTGKMIVGFFTSDATKTLTKPMLEKGTTKTTYEPYNTYEINLGKNLFDGIFRQGIHVSTTTANRICSDNAMKSENGSKYTFSTNLPNTFKWKIMNCTANGTSTTVIDDTNYTSSGSVTVTCTINGYLKVLIGKTNDGNLTPSDIANYQFQVELGSQASSYSAYKEPIELCKIGTYQDKIYKDNGKWYLHKEIGKYTFTGNETISLQNNGKRIYVNSTASSIPEPLHTTSISQTFGMYCNKLVEVTAGQTWGATQGISYDYNSGENTGNFDISINGVSTLADYRTAIAGIIVYYILQTPTNTQIEDSELLEQLDSLDNMKSCNGQTNISITSNDLPLSLSASAVRRWQ